MVWRDTLRTAVRRAAVGVVLAASTMLGIDPKPLDARAATPSIVPVLTEWDVVNVREALRQHENGVFQQSALLADHMGRNDRIQAVMRTRMYAALSLPFELKPQRGGTSLAAELAPRWKRMMPRSVCASIIRDCAMMGFSICQRIWTLNPRTGLWDVRLKRWHPTWVRFDFTLGVYIIQTREGIEYCPPDNSNPRWCLFTELDDDRPWMSASIRALAIPFLIVVWADRDWARWSEKHGLPPLVAKVPSDMRNDPLTDEFLDSLQELGTESSILAPQFGGDDPSYDIDFRELKNWQSYQGFEALANRQDKRFAITLLGQNLTTDVTGGSYAAASAHELVRQDYLEADALLLSEGGRQCLCVPWTIVNEDPDPLVAEVIAPTPVYDATPPEDGKLRGEAMTALGDGLKRLQDAGVDVDVEAEAEKAGITLRAKEEGAARKAKGQVFAWHITTGMVTPDEGRSIALGLPPLPDGLGAKPVPVPGAKPDDATPP